MVEFLRADCATWYAVPTLSLLEVLLKCCLNTFFRREEQVSVNAIKTQNIFILKLFVRILR